jgi:hypothetical protein
MSERACKVVMRNIDGGFEYGQNPLAAHEHHAAK